MLDAVTLLEACLSERLQLWEGAPITSVSSGDLFIFNAAIENQRIERDSWTPVVLEGIYNISQHYSRPGFVKKESSVKVKGSIYRIVMYYDLWESILGPLVCPSSVDTWRDVVVCDELQRYTDIQESPMERFCSRAQQMFSTILSDWYRWKASGTDLWTPESLRGKLTQSLLWDLLLVSTFTVPGMSDSAKESSPKFTPLQNIMLYLRAFGLFHRPLSASRPLQEKEVRKNLGELQINLKESSLVQHKITLEAKHQDAIDIGIQHLYERFEIFRYDQNPVAVWLHQIRHHNKYGNAEVGYIKLREWTGTYEADTLKSYLVATFKKKTPPEVYALMISTLFTFWWIERNVRDWAMPKRQIKEYGWLGIFQGYINSLSSKDPSSKWKSHQMLEKILASFWYALDILPDLRQRSIQALLRDEYQGNMHKPDEQVKSFWQRMFLYHSWDKRTTFNDL
ncbi:hypothetical protein ACLMJK_007673 [Lecanora helva]